MTQHSDWIAEREVIKARLADYYVVVRNENYADLKERYDEMREDLRRLLAHSEEDEREKEELRIVLKAAALALHSYKYGNASTDLADEIIERAERLLQ